MIQLRTLVGQLRGSIERVLPDGCPFVIGGGLVRDALYGGRPNDIDIWLPSNIHVPDVDAFCAHLVRSGFGPNLGYQGQIIFRGPGSRVEEVEEGVLGGFGNAEHDNAGYGDVHNHWVVELQPAPPREGIPVPNVPRINFMRNMARWTGDAPSFFTEIMRNFDLDLCMYFVGYMPGQTQVNTVIMPQHLRDSLMLSRRNGRIAPTRINEVYWNQARLETTSTERIISRVRKMNSKYALYLSENIENIQMIPTAEIVAVPMLFRELIKAFNNGGGYGYAALPTRNNRLWEHQYEEALELAQQEFTAYRETRIRQGFPIPQHVTVQSFFRTRY